MMIRKARCDERALRAEAAAGAARRIALFFKRLANRHRRRRQIAALASLDDRTLKDIGLSRNDVQDAISQPLGASNPLVRRYWHGAGDRSLEALARLDDRQIPNLSETGQRLRREAQRPR